MRRTAQEGEGGDVAVQKGLGGLRGIGLDEAPVAVGQVDDEAVGLALHAADDHQGLAKVALGMARRVGQRHEHLTGPAAVLPDVVLDDGVSTVEPVFVPDPLVDAPGRVALLLGNPVILFEDAVDDTHERLKFGPTRWDLSPIARRGWVVQHLAHRVPVQPEHPGSLPNAHAFHHHCPANPQIDVHAVHPWHHP